MIPWLVLNVSIQTSDCSFVETDYVEQKKNAKQFLFCNNFHDIASCIKFVL